jgi:hypothetical protein
MRRRLMCETHASYLRGYSGFRLISLYKMSTHTGYREKVEIYILIVWTTDYKDASFCW